MRILVIDNYDSFTFNVVQLLGMLGAEVQVILNDELSAAAARALPVDGFVLSPGPCTPNEAGICLDFLAEHEAHADARPVLGVCLGHQSIGQAYGGQVVRAPQPMHGQSSPVLHRGEGLFAGAEQPLEVGRYHSLVVDAGSVPAALAVDAWTEDGLVMALRHTSRPIHGLQFHPESLLTPNGRGLVANWLRLVHAPT